MHVSAASNVFTHDLNFIAKWSAEHGLVLNTSKSVAIICGKYHVHRIKSFNLIIKIGDTLIPIHSCVRNLGFIYYWMKICVLGTRKG